MTCNRKKHKVVAIGLEQALAFIDSNKGSSARGRRLGEQNARSLTLMLAFGVDAATANSAANNRQVRDNSAAHQLKWKAIESISKYIELGLITPVTITPKVTVKAFDAVSSNVEFLTSCTKQELAALKIVMCYGAEISDIERFCGVSVPVLPDAVYV